MNELAADIQLMVNNAKAFYMVLYYLLILQTVRLELFYNSNFYFINKTFCHCSMHLQSIKMLLNFGNFVLVQKIK